MKPKILVVEDDRAMALFLHKILEDQGFESDAVGDVDGHERGNIRLRRWQVSVLVDRPALQIEPGGVFENAG